jgi:predicted phosphodiesterase
MLTFYGDFMENKPNNLSFNIVVISEINGAKKNMYSDGLIGLAHYLNHMPVSEKPNMFIINGGLLPEMPLNRGGPRNQDRLEMVIDGVKNLDGAASVVKSHIKRLLLTFSEGSDFIYVMGKADQKNIEDIKLKFSKLYSRAQESIGKKKVKDVMGPYIDENEVDISSRRILINGLEMKKNGLNKRMNNTKNKEDIKELKGEISKINENLRLNKEEQKEFINKRVLFNMLQQLIYTKIPKEKVKEIINETQKRYDEVNKLLDHTKNNTPEYEKLNREIKLLGNKIRALSKRYKENITEETATSMMSKLGREYRYTSRIPLPKDINTILDQIARQEYTTILKNALGRIKPVKIQSSSLEVYQKSVGGFKFNVILTDGLDMNSSMYKKKSNSALVKTAFIVTTNLGSEVKKQIDSSPLNVLIGSRNGYTSFSMDPWTDQSDSVVAALAKGPFISTKQSTLNYLDKIKTDETQSVQKMVLDSSASILKVYPDRSVVHKTIKAEMLNDEKIKGDIEEEPALNRLIKKFEQGLEESTGVEDPKLANAILSSKRPSEVKNRDMAKADKEIILSLAPNANAEIPKNPQNISIVEFTDVHVGNYGNIELLKSSVKDALDAKPQILVLDGDNIEGNLGNFKYTARPENEIGMMKEYKKWMIEKGMPEKKIQHELLDRYEKLNDNVISNIDAQAKIFVKEIQDLVLDVVKREGYVIVISGNHYNKTHRDSQHDEATLITSHIEMLLEGANINGSLPKDWKSHIKKGSGSDIAAEKFNLNGMNIEIRHGLANNEERVESALESKRTDASIVVTGHGHEIREVTNTSTEVVQGPAMQASATNPYNKLGYFPTATDDKFTGYLQMNLKIKDGKVLEHDFIPRLKDQLRVNDTNFTEFLNNKKKMKVST